MIAVIMGSDLSPLTEPVDEPKTRRTRRSPFDSPAVREPKDPVDRLLARADRFRTEGLFLGKNEAGLSYLRACEALAAETARLDPDRCEAYMIWGIALLLQAQFADDPGPRGELLTAGDERFNQAETCGQTDPLFYRKWAEGMVRVAMGSATADDQRTVFVQRAVDVIQRGLFRHENPDDRRPLLPVAGMIAVAMAETADDTTDRVRWYRRSVERYREADRLGASFSAFHESVYAEALFRIAYLADDPVSAQQSIERGLAWLRREPNQPEAHYVLVRGYALLGDHYRAVRHLEHCVAAEPAKYLGRVAQNEALQEFRESGEYRAFMETHGPEEN